MYIRVIVTCRMLLPEATRAWRKGVPTVLVMETGYDLKNTSKAFQQNSKKNLEMFADYPDLTDRTFKRGDMRYASHIDIAALAGCSCIRRAIAGRGPGRLCL